MESGSVSHHLYTSLGPGMVSNTGSHISQRLILLSQGKTASSGHRTEAGAVALRILLQFSPSTPCVLKKEAPFSWLTRVGMAALLPAAAHLVLDCHCSPSCSGLCRIQLLEGAMGFGGLCTLFPLLRPAVPPPRSTLCFIQLTVQLST